MSIYVYIYIYEYWFTWFGVSDAAVYLECNCREKALHLVCYLYLFQVELLRLVFVSKLQGVAFRVEGLAWVHLRGSQNHQNRRSFFRRYDAVAVSIVEVLYLFSSFRGFCQPKFIGLRKNAD